jgi:RNA polymerase sigma-70 factor (ECF subfamily)
MSAAPEAAGSPTDAELMALVARGDEAAFARLVLRHHAALYGAFRRRGLDPHAAEDCVQDTFLRVLRAAPAYTARAPFRVFLMRVGRNAQVDWHRRRREAGMTLVEPHHPVLRAEAAAPDRAGDRMDLAAALMQLSPLLRGVVHLSVFESLSHAEVAAHLDVPVGTVKSRLFHAVRKLREALS